MTIDPAITIRVLEPRDAAAYAALRQAMLLDSPLAFSGSPGVDPWTDQEVVATTLATPGQVIVGAFRDHGTKKMLVGAAGAHRETKPKLMHLATIWGVFVDPTARGSGVGESIVRKVIEVVRGWEGVRIIGLSAGEGQLAARRLYQRLGFVEWGTEPEVMMHEGKFYNEVHMQLKLI